jgi:hypothetical protein
MTEFPKPTIPECADGPVHNFVALNDKQVYCTKCCANVKFTKPVKK